MNLFEGARPGAPARASSEDLLPTQISTSAASHMAMWIVIASIVAIDAIWSFFSGIAISVGWAVPCVALVLVAASFAVTVWRANKRLASFLLIFAQYVVFANSAAVLSYLAAACGLPLIDDSLASVDREIGFDWFALFNWTNLKHPIVGKSLNLIYWSLAPQLGILAANLSARGRFDRVLELSWLVAVSLLIIIPLSLLMPAEGAWAHYGVSHLTSGFYLPDFRAIRSGEMKVIDLSRITGIIQFPSFHAAMGLILILSSWRTILFPLFLPLNIAMIFSAITAGGHYLTDIVFGLATVAAAVLILQKAGELAAQRASKRPTQM
ncbi:phosphatase PAP2 family protein [Bradyrhizobium sp. 41S5]|uniref:phosphatase PAP2 family protein n=1 Tax=Bradyrhizobium sp. 41S5 TaxID=1404443 RepID=UPI00156BAA0A|nr:phosphatase PAP2 family protein [Bradyrhizobium sp. 41S5]UFX41719.1 phosphatase PAP2 family protein [Bradyrhizobium sp. 41S5]